MGSLTHEERVAVARLRALLELLPTALDRQLSATGLTSFEFTLLEALSEADYGRLRMSALASRTNATLPRLSRVVSSLERKGFVLRAACEADARATNAVLTAAGERCYADSRPRFDAAVSEMILQDLSSADVDSLANLTLAILTRLDPDRRLAVTAEASSECAADSTETQSTDSPPLCAADPTPQSQTDEIVCAADPARPASAVRPSTLISSA